MSVEGSSSRSFGSLSANGNRCVYGILLLGQLGIIIEELSSGPGWTLALWVALFIVTIWFLVKTWNPGSPR